MILYLDSSEEPVTIGIINKDGQKMHSWSNKGSVSELFSTEVAKFLKQNKIKFENLEKIAVVTGPGQFTQIRTGVATANAMGFALGVPVVGLKKNEIPKNLSDIFKKSGKVQILPFYDREPNISKPKRRNLNFRKKR